MYLAVNYAIRTPLYLVVQLTQSLYAYSQPFGEYLSVRDLEQWIRCANVRQYIDVVVLYLDRMTHVCRLDIEATILHEIQTEVTLIQDMLHRVETARRFYVQCWVFKELRIGNMKHLYQDLHTTLQLIRSKIEALDLLRCSETDYIARCVQMLEKT
jgi:hypothetical protein